MKKQKIEVLSDVTDFINNVKKDVPMKIEGNVIYVKSKYKERISRIIKRRKIKANILNKNYKKAICIISAFLILLLVVFVYVFLFNNTVKVEVNCKNEILQNKIENYVLQEYNKDVSLNEIECKIVQNFPSVVLCDVSKKDKTIYVNLYLNEQIKKIEFKESIYSNSDGIVSRVDLISGTALVKKGDIVKKGDVLIKGSYINYLDNEIDVVPKGKIYAYVYKSDHFVILNQKVDVEHEKISNMYSFFIFGKKVFSLGKNLNEEFKSEKIVLNNTLGFSLEKKEFYKIITTNKQLDEEDIEEIINNKEQDFIESQKAYTRVNNIRVIKKAMDNMCFIDIYYELEQCISIEED